MPFLSDLSPHFFSPLSNLPIWPQWESEEKGPREKASPLSGLSQRVIVCFEMGIPYFKVRLGHKAKGLRAMGSSHLALGLENKERI